MGFDPARLGAGYVFPIDPRALLPGFEPGSEREPEPLFQLLAALDRSQRLVLAVPEFSVQRDAAGDQVGVAMRGVDVSHKAPLMLVRIHSHVLEVSPGNFLEPLVREVLAGRQGETAMPNRPFAVGSQPAGMGKLGSETARIWICARQISADERPAVRVISLAGTEAVIKEATETIATINPRLHQRSARSCPRAAG